MQMVKGTENIGLGPVGSNYNPSEVGNATVAVKSDASIMIQEWILVKDRLPIENGLYEVCYEATEISERCCGREWFIDGEWILIPISCHLDIIFWMPLPKPPEANNE